MVKDYWQKRFKKELVEEEDQLRAEINIAVKKKLEAISDAKDDSEK